MSQSLAVYLPDAEGAFLREFGSRVGPGVEWVAGELPQPASYQVLVCGRPTEEQLVASPCLHSLVIPFAGLPRTTVDLLAAFPQVRVFNLHHNASATAELALGLLLAVAREIPRDHERLRALDWSPRYETQGVLCAGKTALVLGHGAVGQHVARACRALGMDVVAVRRRAEPGAEGVHSVDQLHALLPRAEVVVVTLPETARTRGLLGARELSLLPRGALLVNVGRAAVIDEAALHDALRSGQLGGAGLDVWYRYPESAEACTGVAPGNLPLHELSNVVLSPHRAGRVIETEGLRAEHLVTLLETLTAGGSPPTVDLEAGY